MTYKPVNFYWRGQEWTITPVPEDEADVVLGSSGVGKVQTTTGKICYRASLPADTAILTILHEMGHELFPEWSKEPTESSRSELGIFERDLKSMGDAVGIDWSPLLGE